MADLWRALGYLQLYWRTTLGAFISLLIVTLMSLISPQILRVAIRNLVAFGKLPHWSDHLRS